MSKKGAFIVIDGTDGSGKTLHTEILVHRLKKEGKKVKTIDFPRHGHFSSYFVDKYLNGEYGTPKEVGAYQASLFFALDRYDHAGQIKEWLQKGEVVISNRYTSSNMGHQAGKIKNKNELEKFLLWLSNFEYEILKIPKPDLNILLYMPPHMSQKLLKQRERRTYLRKGKLDVHEKDLKHLKDASEAYLYVAKRYKWPIINCTDKGILRMPQDINNEIYKRCKKLLG